MHLGNGAITLECAAITFGAAAVGLGAAAVSMRSERPTRDNLLLTAGLGALIFAAQAINVPVWQGISAHLVGGVLLAWTVGPARGAWTMALILVVQALALGDGGLVALGANVLNMALLPAAIVALVRRTAFGKGDSYSTPALLAALSVPLAAVLIVGETALFRSGNLLEGQREFALRMVGSHLWIGVLEAGLTAAALVALAAVRSPQAHSAWRPMLFTTIAGLALAALVSPWSSALPDGYEAAAKQSGRAGLLVESPAELGTVHALSARAAEMQAQVVASVQTVLPTEQICLTGATLLLALVLLMVTRLPHAAPEAASA